MVEELCTTEQEDGGGGGRKSMFAVVLEEMKKELYPGSAYSRFSFVIALFLLCTVKQRILFIGPWI